MKRLVLPLILILTLISCATKPAANPNRETSISVYSLEPTSYGSGFFITNDGVIVTCAHVIEGDDRIAVVIDDIAYFPEILAIDEETDLAVLRINYRNPYYFGIESFNRVYYGDPLSVIGYPIPDILGSEIRYTNGTVSSLNGIKSDPIEFQHSVPTHSGNSGGPIVNSRLQVIGIAVSVIKDDYVKERTGLIPQNINFGVKSDYIYPLLKLRGIRSGSGNVRNNQHAVRATVQIITYIETTSITVNNRTGNRGMYLYISPSSDESWGPDRLGNRIINNNNSAVVNVPLSDNNRYDLQLVDHNGNTYTKWDTLILPNMTITFTSLDLDRSANRYSVTIVNNTGRAVSYVYISPSRDDMWGTNRLERNQILNSGQSITLNLPHPLNVTNRYDFMIQDVNGNRYSKFNILLNENSRIVFTASDMD